MSQPDQVMIQKLDEWCEECEIHSSPTVMMQKQQYGELIPYGNALVGEMISRMERGDIHICFFILLYRLTNYNPVPPQERGRVPLMVARWVSWYRNRTDSQFWERLREEGIRPEGYALYDWSEPEKQVEKRDVPSEQESTEEGPEPEGGGAAAE